METYKTALPLMTIGLLAFVNYVLIVRDFNNIGYPRDIMYKLQLVENPTPIQFTYYEEMTIPLKYWKMKDYGVSINMDTSNGIVLPLGSYRVGNLGFVSHYPDSAIHVYASPNFLQTDSTVFEKLHFQSHPAYAFEYCTRYGRNIFISKQLKIRVAKIL